MIPTRHAPAEAEAPVSIPLPLRAPRVPTDLYEINWLGTTPPFGPFDSAEAAVSWADDHGLSTTDGYVLRDETGERVATVEEFGAKYPGQVLP